jgi:cell filamentation protein
MYDSIDDPYSYPGTTVLKNRRNLRTQEALDRFELAMTAMRSTLFIRSVTIAVEAKWRL